MLANITKEGIWLTYEAQQVQQYVIAVSTYVGIIYAQVLEALDRYSFWFV